MLNASKSTSQSSTRRWRGPMLARRGCQGFAAPASDANRLRDAIVKARACEVQPSSLDGGAERLDMVVAVLEESDKDGGKSLQPLRDYLANPVMQVDVLQVNVDHDDNYYTRAEEKAEGGYFWEENLINPKARRRLSLIEADRRPGPSRPLGLRLCGRTSRRFVPGAWGAEKGILRMIESCGDPAAQQIDPLLRCRVLAMLVDAALSKAMLADIKSIEAIGDRIGAGVGATPEWVDPAKRRKPLAIAAKNASNQQDIARAVDEGRSKVEEITARPEYCRVIRFAGWAEKRSDEPRLHILSEVLGSSSGVLYAINADGDTSWRFAAVARLSGGDVTPTNTAGLCFGQPLFIEAVMPESAAR
jgi:hypothetical protein